jgi:hypothetical protein
MANPLRLLGIAFALLIAGAVLPFLMLVGLVESTLFLNLVAVVCSIGGATIGFIGIAFYMRRQR